jgi:hypothetical protein
MLDKLKGSWYYKDMNDRLSLSPNQAVGADHPELTPLERGTSLAEGGSPQVGGGHSPTRPKTLGESSQVGGGHNGLLGIADKEKGKLVHRRRPYVIIQFGGRR